MYLSSVPRLRNRALQRGLADAEQAGAVALEIAGESSVQKTLGIVARNGGVPEVELELPVDIGQVHLVEQAPFVLHLLIQGRAGHRRVEHELVEVGVVGDGELDLLLDFSSQNINVFVRKPTIPIT